MTTPTPDNRHASMIPHPRIDWQRWLQQLRASALFRQLKNTDELKLEKIILLAGGVMVAALLFIVLLRYLLGTDDDVSQQVAQAAAAAAGSVEPKPTPQSQPTLESPAAAPIVDATITHAVSTVSTQSNSVVPLASDNLDATDEVMLADPTDDEISEFEQADQAIPSQLTSPAAATPPINRTRQRRLDRIESALRRQPDEVLKAREYGRLLTRLGEYERGEKFYLWYLAHHRDDGEAFFDLGYLYHASEQWHNACKAYYRATELTPQNEQAHHYLAWILATCPDPAIRNGAKAIQAAKSANALLTWPSPEVAETMAASLAEAEQFAAAVRVQKWAVRSAPLEDRGEMMQRLTLYRDHQTFQTNELPRVRREPEAATAVE